MVDPNLTFSVFEIPSIVIKSSSLHVSYKPSQRLHCVLQAVDTYLCTSLLTSTLHTQDYLIFYQLKPLCI